MYGFYITDNGVEKLSSAFTAGDKVALTHYAVGDGGDKEGERDNAITQLNNETYRKPFDENDSFDIKDTKLLIKVVLPNDTPELTFNEVGYFDSEGTLIVYGVMGDVVKKQGDETSPQILEHDNYIEFTRNQIDTITVVTGNEALDSLIDRVSTVERTLGDKADRSELNVLQTTITNNLQPKFEQFENDLKLKASTQDLSSLEQRVKVLEGLLDGVQEKLEALV